MEKIGSIMRTKQPDTYWKLNKKNHKKKGKSKQEHLSFNAIERMMKYNPGIDERKCR